MTRCAAALAAWALLGVDPAAAQTVTHRGFVESRGFWFPADTPTDRQHLVLDLLAREEIFVEAASWLRLAAGVDARANSGDQVEAGARPDLADRGIQRPMVSIRRLQATATRGPLTLDAGKQFIRWGKTDIVTPTDRFAPRDFLNVIDTEFLAVRGVRAGIELSPHTIDAVWVPVFTPSRLPLLGKRWAVLPADLPLPSLDARTLPTAAQAGIRWSYTASRFEGSVSVYDGFNHVPIVASDDGATLSLRFPRMRMYGGDAAVPTRWVTIKAEAAWFSSSTEGADDYVLYVIQIERQSGEWQIVGGYAGEVATGRPAGPTSALDRGAARSFLGRASYTIDPIRSVAFESAVRENLDGVYVKAEYSQASGNHWRTTIAVSVLGGEADDVLGQYRRNSHAIVAVRYSF
jgi:hypothetical protein